ncbi:AAA family ATPase [Actinoplanes sp. CA-131856]
MTTLRGRAHEQAVLTGLIEAARSGRSGVLVLLGEAGVGKTALLDETVKEAGTIRVDGVEAERELPFAALHQLCAPLFDHLEKLPEPQRDALRTTFGLRDGVAPEPFFVGLAVLSLLSEAATSKPLICVIDDAQWLDHASAQTLAFVARRLLAESVVMIFAVRTPAPETVHNLRSLPELRIEGLRDPDARELLASVVRWPLDERVREAILAEARGNPLALLELPGGRAGGFAVPDLRSRVEESFAHRVDDLPTASRLLLLLAAADPVGDSALLWRAAAEMGIGRAAADQIEVAGLLQIGVRVVFRHPLVRSAVYRSAPAADLRRVHAALAAATDPRADPDRRAWHHALATDGTDEEVAAELEASAGRAQARGGLAAAAAFLQRAAELTDDSVRRADRDLAAARATYLAGSLDEASALLNRAQAGPHDELRAARADLLRAQMAFASPSRSQEAPALLLQAARRFAPLDVTRSRDTYLEAFSGAVLVGRFAGSAGLAEVATAARSAPRPHAGPRAADLLLDGLALLFTDGFGAGAPPVRRALADLRRGDVAAEEAIHLIYVVSHAAHAVWDDEVWQALTHRHLRLARGAGALAGMSYLLYQRLALHLHQGELAQAAALVEEVQVVGAATGNVQPDVAALAVAGWRGREAEVARLTPAVTAAVTARHEGAVLTVVHLSNAVLLNGLGRFPEALAAAERATAYPLETGFANWALVELAEAAVRAGDREAAGRALERIAARAEPSGTDWGLGAEARARALITGSEDLYREAIDRLARCRGAFSLARAHLVYGEWLRREDRAADARVQLRTAHDMFVSFGADAFAARARRELSATGETVRGRTPKAATRLTPQEGQIARRARDGQTNAEIGAELFLSSRTVEWHLRKIFGKLGVANRRELRDAL